MNPPAALLCLRGGLISRICYIMPVRTDQLSRTVQVDKVQILDVLTKTHMFF